MKETNPPKWADRFLAWYCNDEILEEIQGDIHELYAERLLYEGKRRADLKYILDVIRFFRWSNIRRIDSTKSPSGILRLWGFNFKLASRDARKNKTSFAIKLVGLSVCIAFTLILTAFVSNELSYDKFHSNHDRIYRISSLVNFKDHTTHYAVTPLPIGKTIVEGIPEVEGFTRLMYEDKPAYHIGDSDYYDEITLAVDSGFLRMLTFNFLSGSKDALDEPNKIVLTETTAKKFFGDQGAIGKFVEYKDDVLLEVSGIIKDFPSNTHLKFDALISWSTIRRYDDWGNLNAYTYILLKEGAIISNVKNKMPSLLNTFHELVAREYKATYEPIFEKITDIHFSKPLDEDIAEKRNRTNLSILIAVIFLFLITGIVNFLNLTMAEITTNLKRNGIIRTFGGLPGSDQKILFADTLFTILIVIPISTIVFYACWNTCRYYFSIEIDQSALGSLLFTGIAIGFLLLIIASTSLNAIVLRKATNVVNSLKGKLTKSFRGTPVRKVLVGTQLVFSTIMIALMLIVVDQFRFIQESDKGYEDQNIIVIKLRSGDPRTIESFIERIRKLKGIKKVDGCSYYPGILETKYVFEVESEKGHEELLVPMMQCGYDYLDVLGINVIDGRQFDPNRETDRTQSFIINETAAREFGWKDPIGKIINGPVGGDGDAFHEGEVIGVVHDFNFQSLHTKIEPLIIFLNDDQWYGSQFIYIKTNPITSADLISSIEASYKTLWTEPFDWEYLDSKYLSLYEKDFEMKTIFEMGLVISILISCFGIFGLSALIVNLRTKEMGVRKIVGANAKQLFFLHIKTFFQFLAIGIPLAFPFIYYLSQDWLANFAYHIDLNIYHFLIPALLAFIIVFLTSGYHAIRGALINPIKSLKQD